MPLDYLTLINRGSQRSSSVRTEEGEFRFCLLVVQCNASSSDAIEDGLLNDCDCIKTFSARHLGCYVQMDLNVGVGVNDCDHTWWAGEETKLNAVAIKRLLSIKKKVPPIVPCLLYTSDAADE